MPSLGKKKKNKTDPQRLQVVLLSYLNISWVHSLIAEKEGKKNDVRINRGKKFGGYRQDAFFLQAQNDSTLAPSSNRWLSSGDGDEGRGHLYL